MLETIAHRLLHLVIVLFLVSICTLLLLELVPGDPAAAMLGEAATQEQIAAAREQIGSDASLPVRYWRWLSDAVTGDLGSSFRTKEPVVESLVQRLPVTAELAVLTLFCSLAVAIPVAVYAAHRRGKLFDRVVMFSTSAGMSSPSFLAAIFLIYFLAVVTKVFPPTGWVPLSESMTENVRHAFLPVASLCVMEIAMFVRLLRTDMVHTLSEDHILAARAAGLPTWQLLFKRALRPSSYSLITVAGISLGRLLGGTVIVEVLFTLPGIGQYIVQAILNKDLPAVQGAVLFVAATYVVINVIVELVYLRLDPRVGRGATT